MWSYFGILFLLIYRQGMVQQLEESLNSSDRLVGHLRAEKQKDSIARKALLGQHSREMTSLRTQLIQV